MSKIQFQAKVSLVQAVLRGDGDYDVQILLRDGEGVFQGSSIREKDVLVFDTGVVEPGTYTRYDVIEVSGVSWTGEIELVIRYRQDNTNDYPDPELDYLVGEEGVISRPSAILGLLPVVSPQAQELKDAFSFYLLNHNLDQILDHPRDDGIGSGGGDFRLYTAQWLPIDTQGRALMPKKPIGDIVLNMGLVFLMDGSMVEILGVTIQHDVETDQYRVAIPPADVAELAGNMAVITVSYLVEND